MGYLITTDYLMQIQPQLRAQINALAIARAELTAKEEINGYVSKKYDTSAEFTETLPYNPANAYNSGQRAVIDFSPINPSSFKPNARCTAFKPDLPLFTCQSNTKSATC